MKLHTINQSPFNSNGFTRCLTMALPGSAILLIEDGVYGALAGGQFAAQLESAMAEHNIYALQADVQARGLANRLMTEVKLVDYAGFVDLAIEHEATIAW